MSYLTWPCAYLIVAAAGCGTGTGTPNGSQGSGRDNQAAGATDLLGDGAASGNTTGDHLPGGDTDRDGGGTPSTVEVGPIDVEKRGPLVVGTARVEVEAFARSLPVQLWYPAVESARGEERAGRPTADFEPPGDRHDTLSALVDAAPDGCTRKTMQAADAPEPLPQAGAWPWVVFSHCMDCVRFSAFSIAEHLASWGFVVAAPDHEGGTLYDERAGRSVGLTGEFLKTRGEDVRGVLDALLDGSALPAGLRGKLDATRIGMFGHSYGAVTTGLVLQDDPRVKVGVFIAAPPQNPLLGGVDLQKVSEPAAFLLAREDNSISEIGNLTLRNNFDTYPSEAWLVEVSDAGHWSFSDLCGLIDTFDPGCGEGMRQTNALATVTYLANDLARSIGRAYVLATFARALVGDEAAGAYLEEAHPEGTVSVMHHD